MPAPWPEKLEQKLRDLVAMGRYTYPEIAEIIGKSKSCIIQKAVHLKIKNPTYLRRHTKTKHLREAVFKYFLTHSFEEVCEKFNITASEAKSIFTIGYKDPKLAQYRKDTRVKERWSEKEVRFLVKRLGLKNRLWIAKKLKRSKFSYHAIKDQQKRMGIRGKHFHGLAQDHAALLFGIEIAHRHSIKTDAGPLYNLRIIPWVTLEWLAKEHGLDLFWCRAFSIQASLQRWIYGMKTEKEVLKKINEIIKEK